MLAACEVGEVFALLEGGAGGAREASDVLVALYSSVRDPWLTRALLAYHARTGSARAVDLLARAPDLHARFLLDALQEQLRADRASRQHALAAFAPLVARRPAWLHRLSAHPLAREVARAARSEREPVPLLHALLALAALLPAAPALGAHLAAELADALLRPAPHPLAARAQLALFRALYATHPCTLLEHWRAAGADLPPAPRAAWRRAVAALADRVRLHPALVTGSRQREADPARWARLEAHDVLDESRRLDVRVRRDATPEPAPAVAPPPEPPRGDAAPGSGAFAARALSALRPGGEQWFALAERCAADSAPPTPLPVDVDASEPPEAAVEATPENTPARETRAQFRFPAESGAVRAIGRRSRPASPPRKETSPSWAGGAAAAGEGYSSRLARVALDRRAADSPVPFAGAPPPPGAAVARPEPNRPPAPAEAGEPLNLEDREVLELTARAPAECEWAEWASATPGRDSARPRDPRDSAPALGLRRAAPGPRRAASCSPRLPGVRRSSVAVQTVDTWPEPYEFMIADLFRSLPDDLPPQSETHRPCERLDEYMADLYAGRPGSGNNGSNDLAEQLELAHAQLMYERWRREAHAERNRRLLGRCRQTRALELQNAALQERVRGLQLERDELRCRLQREPPPPPPAAPPGLEDALADERTARYQAEAALKECLAQREIDASELQRARGDSFEAARHVEALARAAMAAERRAEHVRRLRRELLILAERDKRLTEAVRKGTLAAESAANNERAQQDDRALRAAWARAEAEAEASAAKAEAASARAHELEATLAARDATIAELKRATRLAAEEGAAQLRALRDKYSALLRVVRAKEAHQLDQLAAPAQAPAPRQPRDALHAASAGRS